MPPGSRLFLRDGREVVLAGELARGGEGAVYQIGGRPDEVAKVYFQPPDDAKAAKLAAMTEMRTERLSRLTAWPLEVLYTASGCGAGFTMRRLAGQQPVHTLYGPKTRQQHFPTAKWDFLVQSAANMARAFADVHAHGVVVGDVNHANVVVFRDSTCRLIDCDSFQIQHNRRIWRCMVGVETHTPPELQGVPLGEIVRTANHDCFGLAVLIFQLLFMGRLPFSGRTLDVPDIAPGRAIKEFRFAYSADAARRRIERPAGTLSLAEMPRSVATLFERAFCEAAARKPLRPSPGEWSGALDDLRASLRRCAAHPEHMYYEELPYCPWCALQQRFGVSYFLATAVTTPPGAERERGQIEALWRSAERVPRPEPPLREAEAPALPPSVAAVRRHAQIRVWLAASALITVILAAAHSAVRIPGPAVYAAAGLHVFGWVAWIVLCKIADEISRSAARRYSLLVSRGNTVRRQEEYERTLAAVSGHRELLLALDAESVPQRRERAAALEREQRQRHLAAAVVSTTSVPGLGAFTERSLRILGVQSAADVTPEPPRALLLLPGRVSTQWTALRTWRASVERSFRFDSSAPEVVRALAELDSRTANSRRVLLEEMRQGVDRLRVITAETQAEQAELRKRLPGALQAYGQAAADARLYRRLVG